MTDFITSLQTTITGWASPIQTSVTAILTTFVAVSGIFVVASLITRAFKRGAK